MNVLSSSPAQDVKAIVSLWGMDLAFAHVVTLFSMLGSCFFACFLPSVIHIHAEPHSRKQRVLSTIKRYCNCLSGGVFAGAFFTQFYPLVVHEFSELFQDKSSIWNHPIQLGPSIVFCGFLLTALLERLVGVLMKRLRTKKASKSNELTASSSGNLQQENDAVVDRMPLVLSHVTDDEDEDCFDTDLLSRPKDTSVNINSTELNHPAGSRSSSASRHSHHHHHGEHNQHHHHNIAFEDYQGTTRFVVLVASLGTHSIFEGLALGLVTDVGILMNMFLSIVLHEVLMALALGMSLSHQKMKRRAKMMFSLVFAIIIPLGQSIGLLIQQAPPSPAAHAAVTVLQAIAAGTFLHVMFMEILPQEMNSHFGLLEALWVILGYVLIPLSSLVTGGSHH